MTKKNGKTLTTMQGTVVVVSGRLLLLAITMFMQKATTKAK